MSLLPVLLWPSTSSLPPPCSGHGFLRCASHRSADDARLAVAAGRPHFLPNDARLAELLPLLLDENDAVAFVLLVYHLSHDGARPGLLLRLPSHHLSLVSARPGLDSDLVAIFFRASHRSSASARLGFGGGDLLARRMATHGGGVGSSGNMFHMGGVGSNAWESCVCHGKVHARYWYRHGSDRGETEADTLTAHQKIEKNASQSSHDVQGKQGDHELLIDGNRWNVEVEIHRPAQVRTRHH